MAFNKSIKGKDVNVCATKFCKTHIMRLCRVEQCTASVGMRVSSSSCDYFMPKWIVVQGITDDTQFSCSVYICNHTQWQWQQPQRFHSEKCHYLCDRLPVKMYLSETLHHPQKYILKFCLSKKKHTPKLSLHFIRPTSTTNIHIPHAHACFEYEMLSACFPICSSIYMFAFRCLQTNNWVTIMESLCEGRARGRWRTWFMH